MERRLVVLRHAKSSWKSAAETDHARPLNRRGERDAPKVAERMVSMGWQPDAAFASDAARTRLTWQRMASAWTRPVEMSLVPSFYLGGLSAIGAAAKSWQPEWRTVLVLGHNPGWEDAVTHLTGEPTHLATGSAALLVGSGTRWTVALDSTWRLADLIRPRDL